MNNSIFIHLAIIRLFMRRKLMLFFSFSLIALMLVPQVNALTLRNKELSKHFDNYLPPNAVPCNTDLPVPITSLSYTDLSVSINTTGVCVIGCGISNEGNLIDVDESTFATALTAVGLGVTHTLRVSDDTTDDYFEAGGYAGFLIENSSVLQVDLLNAITIRTYLDGALQETNTGAGLLAIGSTLLATDQYYVGFHTTMDFDAVEISIASLAGVLSSTNIYHAVTSSFCEG